MKFLFYIAFFVGLILSVIGAQRPCPALCPQGEICINGTCKPRDECKVICGFAANICCGRREVCIADGCQKRFPL